MKTSEKDGLSTFKYPSSIFKYLQVPFKYLSIWKNLGCTVILYYYVHSTAYINY